MDIVSFWWEMNVLTPLEAVGEYLYRSFLFRRKRAPLLAWKRVKNEGMVAAWLLLPDFLFRGVTIVSSSGRSPSCFFGGCHMGIGYPCPVTVPVLLPYGRWWASVSSSSLHSFSFPYEKRLPPPAVYGKTRGVVIYQGWFDSFPVAKASVYACTRVLAWFSLCSCSTARLGLQEKQSTKVKMIHNVTVW